MSTGAFRSSGDLAADRRYLWAEASERDGDLAGAADLYRQAADAMPGWPVAWFALGRTLALLERRAEAAEAFVQAERLDPDDVLGARLHLARLSQATIEMPAAYVAGLFDAYAERFDTHLTSALQYRGPEIVAEAIRLLRPPPYGVVLDLGCGTGLMGEALRGQVAALDGVDLSPNMLQQAGKRGLYRHLIAGDVVEVTRMLACEGRYELMIAADVLVYLGDLSPLFQVVRSALADDGLFAFTVQSQEGAGYELGPDLRFAHSEAYIRAQAVATGLTVRMLTAVATRQDAGRDVPGLCVVLG